MAARFGTDGIRGVANRDLTPELALAVGRAAARALGGARFIVGRDTRRSGPLLAQALTAGVLAEGVDVVDVGILPTPGVAALAAAYGAPGAVVSASHNPFADNGVKLFAAGGRKLDDRLEAAVEAGITAALRAAPAGAPTGRGVGGLVVDAESAGWYVRQVASAIEGRSLAGLPVVLDCGNGAASVTAAEVFTRAGAEVVEVIGDRPDGTNINEGCGSTEPGALQAAVLAHRAALGLAFDGDADRVIAVDGAGAVVDGDRLLALFALDLRARGRLSGDTVAVTVMTNLGFHRAMARAGIAVHATDVGDRHVLAALDEHGWDLGGEQSGHLVFRRLATTGDGVLSGLLLADLVARTGTPLADAAGAVMQRLPQVLRNVAVGSRDGLAGARAVWTEVAAVEADLAGEGRVLLRPSGTENVVRVMVEAPTEAGADAAASRLAAAVTASLGPQA